MAVVALFAACSDSDDWNTNDVTVGFAKEEFSFNESAGTVKIPFTITGERNGDIKLVVKENDSTAISGAHFIITSDEINIPQDADSTEVFYLEARIIDDGSEENDDRVFTLDIQSINGATVGIGHATVILKDVDANPYFKLLGKYTVYALDMLSDNADEVTFEVTLTNTDGYDDYSGEKIVVMGMLEQGTYDGTIPWLLDYDEANSTLTLDGSDPYFYAAYNFGSFLGAVAEIPYEITSTSAARASSISATYTKEYNEITFAQGSGLASGVFDYDSSTGNIDINKFYGYMDLLYITKMVRKE